MYERYWKLERAPFDQDRRTETFYSSRFHGEALIKLKYLIEHGKGSASLVGASGTGKTHVLELVRQSVTRGPVVHLLYPQLTPHELVSYITHELDANPPKSAGAVPGMDLLLQTLEGRLTELTQAGQSPVIMIDDAHLIDDRRVFQTLHQLMNFQRPGRTNFSLILAGQPELAGTLQRHEQMSDRIAFQCLLQSLTAAETAAYVRHRLLTAGRTESLFDDSALRAIFELSGGIPRRINRLCDFALLIGYANQLAFVSSDQIEGVHAEITRSPIAA
ncbi:ExeA family protein [Schlesneria paludicola]|uniref:ExeA family protein n=1 Tax=Schlesneria paludicola TaxID=360056 RepID=UPI00029B44E9|nr:AAA family ATPase [Schlesneria paludicola]